MKKIETIADYLHALDARTIEAQEQAEIAIGRARHENATSIFTQLNGDCWRGAAKAGQSGGRLSGVVVTVKDLFDVAGDVTTAGSKVLKNVPNVLAATRHAPAVARVLNEGAVLLGRTNMTEFAFSGVGINPHYGTPANACSPGKLGKPGDELIPGGSSSGGAVAVALGLGMAALGTDTGGSLRIPAALNGIVGFKPTARRVPQGGCVPLAPSLDTVGAMTRNVVDAIVLDDILADAPAQLSDRKLKGMRFLVPDTLMLDDLDDHVAAEFEAALAALSKAGAVIESFAMPLLAQLSQLNAKGGLSPFEAMQWHKAYLTQFGQDYDPRVKARIEMANLTSQSDYEALKAARIAWQAAILPQLAPFDAMICPTVPMVAPKISEVNASEETFFATNKRLLRNPSVVNFMDGCSISLPCHRSGLPVGLMLSHNAMKDGTVLTAARVVEAELSKQGRVRQWLAQTPRKG